MSYVSGYTDRIFRMNFWRYWVSKIFNRPEPGDTPFPIAAWFRQGRVFEGALRLAPLGYLDSVSLAGDFSPDELAAVARRQADYVAGNSTPPIEVRLLASGTITVARAFLPTLAAARAVALDEIAVRVFYS